MMDVPETRYARYGDAHIAYQVLGDGPDLLFVPLASLPIDLAAVSGGVLERRRRPVFPGLCLACRQASGRGSAPAVLGSRAGNA
jgi:hypothetical protein